MKMIDIVLIIFILVSIFGITALNGRLRIATEMKGMTRKTAGQERETAGFIDYGVYHLNSVERIYALLTSASFLFCIGYIFYRSILLAILLTPACLGYPTIRAKQLNKRRKDELKLQFKDSLQSLSASLQAGNSFESSIRNAVADLHIQYETDAYIVQEYEVIARKLESNETVEKAFRDFAVRSHLDEILGFAETLEICKRTGGNLVTAVKISSEIISDKIEVLNEIHGILNQKKLEQRILTVMPVVLILMLSMSAKDFMQPVFTEVIGRIVMTFSIVIFGAAYFIAEKITNIEV